MASVPRHPLLFARCAAPRPPEAFSGIYRVTFNFYSRPGGGRIGPEPYTQPIPAQNAGGAGPAGGPARAARPGPGTPAAGGAMSPFVRFVV
ncbi:MAG: hypothetical protein AVDCRST_MAG56-115 [uncultured Cytophagales bacterium]|uniref:Uncharacterized protein n=1 Tax=uncultured Cytophagales bacterium TaxID=158755 RepID=A0A6J4H4U4_9SPHI|nr:MAG: hypothetical protein AVDCRST_MAG56-115 [uncultured Cytophagales bacterium]